MCFIFLKARERGVFRDWLQIRRGASGDSGDSGSTNTAASSAHHGQDEPLAVPHVPQDPRAPPRLGLFDFTPHQLELHKSLPRSTVGVLGTGISTSQMILEILGVWITLAESCQCFVFLQVHQELYLFSRHPKKLWKSLVFPGLSHCSHCSTCAFCGVPHFPPVSARGPPFQAISCAACHRLSRLQATPAFYGSHMSKPSVTCKAAFYSMTALVLAQAE
jgi:hypothetical protein